MSTFDPYDWESFFFGAMERDEACRLLASAPVGSFLLRESRSRVGGYSLSVRECSDGDHQIYNYFIERKEVDKGKLRFEMCGNVFVDIPSLITHYQMHVLEKSCLVRPIMKQAICKVIGRYKFDGERVSDLPFERGEILEIIGKPEESWWTARNSLNNIGLIPVPYVKLYEEGDEISLLNPSTNSSSGGGSVKRFSATSITSDPSSSSNSQSQAVLPRSSQDMGYEKRPTDSEKCSSTKLSTVIAHAPAWVRVIADRFPSIYDVDSLPLKQGQLIYLIEVMSSGMCRGQVEVGGRIGFFPFSYIEWTNIPLDSGPWTPIEV